MDKNSKKQISVVIPTYNEADNIQELVSRIDDALGKSGFTYEVIIIDDNSTDGTLKVAEFFSKKYPISYFLKKGKKGKAYSLQEGFAKSNYANIAIIDADLQYPPEAIPEMVRKLNSADIVLANRKDYKDSLSRRITSKSFKLFFGKILFGLDHDIQAGLKVFKKHVVETVRFSPGSAWTFDLEFLHRAREAGFSMTNYNITFNPRKNGLSKVGTFKSSIEIGLNALKVRTHKIHPIHIPTLIKGKGMMGEGIGYKRKQYITHTTLNHNQSAIQTFHLKQKLFIAVIFASIGIGFFLNIMVTLSAIIAILSSIYFLDVVFNLFLILKSLHSPQEISVPEGELASLEDSKLPTYTILCPLYKEGHIISQFVTAISKLSWPKNKLDVILLLESDDRESIKIARDLNLPNYIRIAIVPNSQPKTKPKACNYGLSIAKGEYLVIYDAEDIPDILQLKKAYVAFQKVKSNVKCLQAKLNYHNPNQNLLTRFFTAEYSLWFNVTLTGYQSINTTIPLGGTSNHFRTKDLIALKGWDPFNVTEDADLGVRLFKRGYKTAIIDSTTLEEANSKWGNWTRQRSRWIKGYMQTYLVHTRQSLLFAKHKKHHFPIFNLVIGGKIAFILINPLLWVATISYFTLYQYVGPSIESLYPAPVFYMAVFSLVFGNFLYLYYYMIGCMKREQYSLIKYVFIIPIYWLMISVAGSYALFQLLFKPHYWEKTTHGLNIRKIDVNNQGFFIPKSVLSPIRYGLSLLLA